jgi:glycosyltransferase involved in cell wall biosynthesis
LISDTKPLTIAFVTPGYDVFNVRRGSGTFYYLAKELSRQGCVIQPFGPLSVKDPLQTRILRYKTKHLLKSRYLSYLDPWVANARKKILTKTLKSTDYNILLTNDHGIAAYFRTSRPVVLYTDVMLPRRRIQTNHQAYPSAPYPMALIYKHTIKKALECVSLAVFPSEWQIREARQYRIPEEKLALIPFGANIPDPGLDVAQHRNFDNVARTKKIDLLFVGKDWLRKGGPIAVQVATHLREQGFDAVLHVVGTTISNMPDYIKFYGLLDKNDPDDWKLLDSLYRNCHLFIFPSSSEGSAIVPREASAYGMPTLAYRIDGLAGAVENGISGVLLELGSNANVFVDVIQNWLDNPELYQQLTRFTRRFYEEKANWIINIKALLFRIYMLLRDAKQN